ncbi:hypothetical protein ACHWUR_00100 [Klebsiella pneumoniae]
MKKLQRRFANVMKIKQSLLMKRTQSLQRQNVNMIVQFLQLEINTKEIVSEAKAQAGEHAKSGRLGNWPSKNRNIKL